MDRNNPLGNSNSGFQTTAENANGVNANGVKPNSVGVEAASKLKLKPYTAANDFSKPADQNKTLALNMNDGNFHPSAEPDGSSTDDDYDMKVTTAEKAKRVQELKEMGKGTTPEDRDRGKRPNKILKLYEDAYPVIKEHWWEDRSEGHNQEIAEINTKIEALNRQKGHNFARYKFPSSEIRLTIDTLRACFEQLKECLEQDHAKASRIVEDARLVASD